MGIHDSPSVSMVWLVVCNGWFRRSNLSGHTHSTKGGTMKNTQTINWRSAIPMPVVLMVAALLAAPAHAKNVDVFASGKSSQINSETAVASARSLSTAFRSASEKMLPSLVAIEVKPKTSQRLTTQGMPRENHRGPLPPGYGRRPQNPAGGIGSGVIINAKGLVLTNNHVVRGGGDITIRLNDGREFKSTNVWTDPKTDLALVEISGAENLAAAKIADSDSVEVGDWVLAMGQPFGLESTVTAGIISAKHRGIGITDRENFLQTDAAINPGNSGGPLVDLDGQIVGINTAISSSGGGNDGIGFAIPINLAKWVANELYNHGQVRRGYLGVNIQPVSAKLANQFDIAPRQGVIVSEVLTGSPAEDAGLQPGDVIVSLGGKPVNTPSRLQLAVEQTSLGSRESLKVIREGKTIDVSFVPREPSNGEGIGRSENVGQSREFGFDVQELTPELANKIGFRKTTGLVITEIAPGSAAAKAGLKPGMVLATANHKELRTWNELNEILKQENANEGVLFLVHSRSEGSRFIVLKPA